MKANWQRGVLRLMRVTNYPAQVTGVTEITPWYHRIGLGAPEFLADFEVYPTMWVRLWVPSIETVDKIVQRAYTLVDPDPVTGSFSLDFVLHEPKGAAGVWAERATAGDLVEIACTPQPLQPDRTIERFVLAGDASALPAINSLLKYVSADAEVTVLIEDGHDDRDHLPVERRNDIDLHWLDPGPDRSGVAGRIAEISPDPNDSYVWVAGEKSLVRQARGVIRDELGFDSEHFHAQTYWVEGKTAG